MLSKLTNVPPNVIRNIEYMMSLKSWLSKEIAKEIDEDLKIHEWEVLNKEEIKH